MFLLEVLHRRTVRALGAAIAGCLAAAGVASAQPAAAAKPGAPDARAAPEAVIAVYPTHWSWAGAAYDDLDLLAEAVLARAPRSVGIYACGDGTARLQKAAAYRFRDRWLELRVLEVRSPPCEVQEGSRVVSLVPGAGLRAPVIDDEAVDRWWNYMMP
jgi:hypothetical protein